MQTYITEPPLPPPLLLLLCAQDDAGIAVPPPRQDVFFRVTSSRPSGHKQVALPRASSTRLSQHDMCVTLHSAVNIDGKCVVELEPRKAQGVASPIAVLSALHADMELLKDGLAGWSSRKQLTYVIAGFDASCSEQSVLQELVQSRAFSTSDAGLHFAAGRSEHMKIAALQRLQEHGITECTSEDETHSRWTLTLAGMQRLRAARWATARFPVFPPAAALGRLSLDDATAWELMMVLKRDGWVLARKPPAAELKRAPLPPIKADTEHKVWYLSSASVGRQRPYMLGLAVSGSLFAAGVLVEFHHFKTTKYYKAIIDGKSDGCVAVPALEDGGHRRPPLAMDVEEVPPPPPLAIMDVLPDDKPRAIAPVAEEERSDHHEVLEVAP